MNYLNLYNNLIESRRNLGRSKKDRDFKYENHHILPRSFGGTDESFNMILLTQKEHWIAHVLLAKLATGQGRYKANQALINMGRVVSKGKRLSSRAYSAARKIIAAEVSKRHTGTLIVKDSITGVRIGRVKKDHPHVLSGKWVFFHVGMKRSDEWKLKTGASVTGEKNPRFTGISNEDILEACKIIFKKYGRWSMAMTKRYFVEVYGQPLPKSLKGKYREPVWNENIQTLLIETFKITDLTLLDGNNHRNKKI